MKRYLFAALLLINSPAIADTNMTNNPVSNSSGSVSNIGVMNYASKQFTNTLSLNQVQCQGDTLVLQPFLMSNLSGGTPKVDSYLEPIYSTKDVKGAFDDNGNEIGDGEVDDPTLIRGYRSIKRFEKTNWSLAPGISLSWNINLDRKSLKNCRKAQQNIVKLLSAKYEDARLSYELGRAKHCGALKKDGILITGKYEMLCQDIQLVSKPNTLIDHSHSIGTTSEEKTTFELP